MKIDIRDTALYQEAESLYKALRQPGTGQISDAAGVHLSPDGREAVFAGTIVDTLQSAPATRICKIDLASGDTRVLTFGPNADRLPKYSPDGRHIAFLSDRHTEGNFRLYVIDQTSGAARPTPSVDGWVEYLHWSPDGSRILLGVAGHGADISGGQGAITSNQVPNDRPSWMPAVASDEETCRWRRTWVYELRTNEVRQVSKADVNVWEANWCGNDALAAVVSTSPTEGFWYRSRLVLLEVTTGNVRELYTPQDQLGWPAASPSGKVVAIVEAICSDRWLVAGNLRLIERKSGNMQRVDTGGVDITFTEWRSECQLVLAGHRGFETVVGTYNTTSGTFTENWCDRDMTSGGHYIAVSPDKTSDDCVLVGESFQRAPEIGLIRGGKYLSVKSFDLGYADEAKAIESVECVIWKAPDELEIQGWLLRPAAQAPHPLIVNLHGGPVWHWRPSWLGRTRTVPILMLVNRGYSIFLPNPRGSSGRGQDFARMVKGDMNGADAFDILSGLNTLIERGLADPTRIGVTGISYGGGMASWLITQDSRFAAAVPVASHTNQVTEHLISNIPEFTDLFLEDRYDNPGGRYFSRSPVMHARSVKTPTMNVCGALDRCTPSEEALQFHNALLENGVKSVLITYPEEGHGVSRLPAAIDYAARVVEWFELHMPADEQGRED